MRHNKVETAVQWFRLLHTVFARFSGHWFSWIWLTVNNAFYCQHLRQYSFCSLDETCVCVCVCVCACVCVHTHVCVCVCVCVCVVHACAYVHTCLCARIHMCVCGLFLNKTYQEFSISSGILDKIDLWLSNTLVYQLSFPCFYFYYFLRWGGKSRSRRKLLELNFKVLKKAQLHQHFPFGVPVLLDNKLSPYSFLEKEVGAAWRGMPPGAKLNFWATWYTNMLNKYQLICQST